GFAIAVSTIAEHLRNQNDGFDSVAANVVANEAAQINKGPEDRKPYYLEVVESLKDLLHVPDE
uniref:hypothetical protein n=1 Tax=Methylobacterium sp. B34 TaxID=95563 RepID=UPI0005B2CD3B